MKAKAKFVFLLCALVVACVLSSVTYRFAREEFIVDNCLSGKHGSFDYAKMSCDLEENHPYVPYQMRHPRDKRIAIVSLAGLVGLAAGYCLLRFVE